VFVAAARARWGDRFAASQYGVNTPNGGVADTVDGVRELAEGHDASGGCVVKSQVLAGGRGKGHFSNGFQGGVHMVDSSEEAATMAENMLGFNLITKQVCFGRFVHCRA